MSELTLRTGGPGDLEWLLGLFDEAVEWMVARGQPGQWGTEPWSESATARERVRAMLVGTDVRVAVRDGVDVGAVVVGDAPPYVEPVDRPERYVLLLIVSRRVAGERIGERLVACATALARERGVGLLRVDCWAGAPTLVAWYAARGFEPAGTFESAPGWVGQVFRMELV